MCLYGYDLPQLVRLFRLRWVISTFFDAPNDALSAANSMASAASELGDMSAKAEAYGMMGRTYVEDMREYDQGLKAYKKQMELSGDAGGVARAYYLKGEIDKAGIYHEQELRGS